ncbi:hypothetical protein LUZ60_006568 [Juncus effusus]|nr:hypothetical protein LUZ60_006568 [Juncus effusus]
MATRAGEKSSFAVTCSLLSNYIKQNGGVADLRLGIPKVETDKSTTMRLLPGLNTSQEKKEEKEKPIMDLFPQETGFGSTESASKSCEKDKSQLTIFYKGKILVFDNFPAEKAKDLMNMASKSTPAQFEPANQSPPPVPTHPSPSLPSPVPVQRPAHPTASDLPIARKASLHRFLEKRKDRLHAKPPYNKVSTSPEKKSSLGLKEDSDLARIEFRV